jgi:hypothetical protein
LLQELIATVSIDQRDRVTQTLVRLEPSQWSFFEQAQIQAGRTLEDWAHAFGISPSNLPPFETANDYLQWIQIVHEPTSDSRNWAVAGSRRWKRSHPDFTKFLNARIRQPQLDVQWMKDNGIVSVLWMSNTTLDRDTFTSMKVVVDGRVWSTVWSYEPEASLESFSRWSRRSDGRPFLRIDLRTQPEDIEKLRHLLRQDQRPPWIIPSCVGSACSALRESKIVDIPSPFDMSPMMTAVYLVISKHFGNSRVYRVQWHNTPGQSRILNASVFSEAGLIATISAGVLSLGAGALYLESLSQP